MIRETRVAAGTPVVGLEVAQGNDGAILSGVCVARVSSLVSSL